MFVTKLRRLSPTEPVSDAVFVPGGLAKVGQVPYIISPGLPPLPGRRIWKRPRTHWY